ncbi:MmpS family transport accessory protein [Actinoplanes sp. DH11]|uniref:MmpS family transport accessory protein n=1 Tax=Actinoplanes sp. DH11 TaxID=2857011 RepID=UPI001E2E8611|nr:MmpS family transport accessory protein [Actinoplanes sp. DH11]
MSDPNDPSEPRQPPRPPQFLPGQATPPPYHPGQTPPPYHPGQAPPPPEPSPDFPPTASFPPVEYQPVNYAPPGHVPEPGYAPDYGSGGYPPPPPPTPGYGPPPPGPRRSKTPLIALIVAISLLLCGGVVTAGVLIVRSVTDRAKEVVEPIANPTLPALPTEVPQLPGLPTDLPGLPTDLPGLPTDLPALPTDLPGLPGDQNREVTVTYEVTGDGPAEILYAEQLGTAPKVVSGSELPWKVTTTMKGVALVSVSAQRRDGGDGTITCRALVDGKEVVKQSGQGPYATTSCNELVFE